MLKEDYQFRIIKRPLKKSKFEINDHNQKSCLLKGCFLFKIKESKIGIAPMPRISIKEIRIIDSNRNNKYQMYFLSKISKIFFIFFIHC